MYVYIFTRMYIILWMLPTLREPWFPSDPVFSDVFPSCWSACPKGRVICGSQSMFVHSRWLHSDLSGEFVSIQPVSLNLHQWYPHCWNCWFVVGERCLGSSVFVLLQPTLSSEKNILWLVSKVKVRFAMHSCPSDRTTGPWKIPELNAPDSPSCIAWGQ